MSDQIKHSDIYEPSLMDGFVKEILSGINVLDNLEKKTLEVSKVIKTNLSASGNANTFDGIRKASEEQAKANKVYNEALKIAELKKSAEQQLNIALNEQSKEIANIRVQLEAQNRANKENAKATNEQLGAYANASARLTIMRKQWKDLAIAQKENTDAARRLKDEIVLLDAQLKKVDGDVGQFGRNVGNYGGAVGQLQINLNQVTRELPAFANSLNTGFMAISNNLPMLIDSINRLKTENAGLVAEGKKAPSVFSSFAGALFSMQTALSLGVTALTLYGGKIVNFITGTEDATEVTKKQKAEQEKLNDEYSLTIKRLDELKDSVTADIDFQTRNLVANAKRSGASEREIAEIERKGREKRLKALEDDYNRKLSVQSFYFDKTLEYISKEDSEEKKAAEDRYDNAKADADKALTAWERAKQDIVSTNNESNLKIGEDDKKSAEDRLKKQKENALKELRLQHEINKTKADATESEIDRKILLLQEELDYQTKVNNIEVDDRKKRAELNIALAEKTQRELGDILYESLDKSIEETNKANDEILKNKEEFYQLFNKLVAEMEEDQAKEDKKKADERLKEQNRQQRESINYLSQAAKERNAIKMREIEQDIELSKRRESELQAIALQGSEDAKNNIAFERRRQAELERERRRQIEAQKRTELGLSVLKAYQSNVERDPNGALKRTLTDISVLSGAIRALPSFEKGTENTGKNGNGIDGRGGFLSVLHPEERVMTKGQNKKVGGLSNDELSDIAWMYNVGMLKNAEVNDNYKLEELNSNVKELISVVRNRPTNSIDIDVVKKLWTLTEKSNKGVTKKTGLFK